jgi:hypothetical protein
LRNAPRLQNVRCWQVCYCGVGRQKLARVLVGELRSVGLAGGRDVEELGRLELALAGGGPFRVILKTAPACRRLWMPTRSNRGRVGGCDCTRRGTDSRHNVLADDEKRLMSANGHFEAKSDGYRCKSIGPILLQELMFWGSASRRRVRFVHLFAPHLPFSPCVVQTCAWLAQRPGPADYIIKT